MAKDRSGTELEGFCSQQMKRQIKKIKFRKLTTKLLDYKAKLIKLINNRFKMNEATSSKIETE